MYYVFTILYCPVFQFQHFIMVSGCIQPSIHPSNFIAARRIHFTTKSPFMMIHFVSHFQCWFYAISLFGGPNAKRKRTDEWAGERTDGRMGTPTNAHELRIVLICRSTFGCWSNLWWNRIDSDYMTHRQPSRYNL